MARWTKTVNIKQFLDETEPADVVAERIRAHVAKAFPHPDLTLDLILADFEEVQTVDECDDVLERLYDWADANNVWLGLI